MNLTETLHATTVAYKGRAVLIRGSSGSGKSSLALRLLALGCDLVADDQTILTAIDGALIATCPERLRGLIEARGVGILRAEPVDKATICLVVDMGLVEKDRLPPARNVVILGVGMPQLHKTETGPFAEAVLQYLKCGRES